MYCAIMLCLGQLVTKEPHVRIGLNSYHNLSDFTSHNMNQDKVALAKKQINKIGLYFLYVVMPYLHVKIFLYN